MADTRPASHGIEPRHNCSALITACCSLTYMSYVTVGQWQQDWVTSIYSFCSYSLLLSLAVTYTINEVISTVNERRAHAHFSGGYIKLKAGVFMPSCTSSTMVHHWLLNSPLLHKSQVSETHPHQEVDPTLKSWSRPSVGEDTWLHEVGARSADMTLL